MTTSFSLHAHVATASSDCDGPMYRDFIEQPNDLEIAEHNEGEARGYNNFADLHFKERVLGNHVSMHSEYGVEVKVTRDGFRSHEVTDEGYRQAEVRWCEDPGCDPEERGQRDVFAEMMNY